MKKQLENNERYILLSLNPALFNETAEREALRKANLVIKRKLIGSHAGKVERSWIVSGSVNDALQLAKRYRQDEIITLSPVDGRTNVRKAGILTVTTESYELIAEWHESENRPSEDFTYDTQNKLYYSFKQDDAGLEKRIRSVYDEEHQL